MVDGCPEWRADLADWVVAQITPGREAALDAHLSTCAACRAEADELMAIAAVALAADVDALGGAPADLDLARTTFEEHHEPPAELGPRIAARITRERRRQTVRRSLVAAVGAAAAAAVVVVALLVTAGGNGIDHVHGEQFAFSTMPSGAAAHAVVGADGKGSVVELAASGLDPSTTYALWLSDPATHPDRVPAGTFRPESDGSVHVVLRCALPAGEVGRVWATSTQGIALDTA